MPSSSPQLTTREFVQNSFVGAREPSIGRSHIVVTSSAQSEDRPPFDYWQRHFECPTLAMGHDDGFDGAKMLVSRAEHGGEGCPGVGVVDQDANRDVGHDPARRWLRPLTTPTTRAVH